MGYLIDGYKIMGKEIQQYVIKHRSGIGTAVSIGGTVVSNILSTRAGAKSARQIDAKSAELGRPLTTMEKAKLCWTNHIGSTLTATASCLGAGYSHNEHVKDFEKVAMAYSGVKKLYDASKKATKEALGEKKAAEIQDKVNQQYIQEHPEIQQKITAPRTNPDPATMQKYWEPIFGYVGYSTRDKIDNGIKAMNAEMDALPKRNKHIAGRNGMYGIRIRKFYEYAFPDAPDEIMKSTNMDNLGFSKGSDVSDDDLIAVYYTPMLINGDTEACIAINWEQDPGDMTYGDYVKF